MFTPSSTASTAPAPDGAASGSSTQRDQGNRLAWDGVQQRPPLTVTPRSILRHRIGIDDGSVGRNPGGVTDERARAERFADLFRAVYLTFHRRDGPRSQLPGASRAVLEHLALAGPLTVGEAAAHMSRAQSVISEIVTHLERQGLLEREDDPADRRRTLIWLTPAGHETLRRDREVLGVDHLARSMARLPPGRADELIAGLRTLVDLATPVPLPPNTQEDHS